MLSRVINFLKQSEFGRFFEVGATARGEHTAHDYDLIVVPNKRDLGEWTAVLKKLGTYKVNGRKVDAQIIPSFNPDDVDKEKKYSKYIYSDKNPNPKIYRKVANGLWKKKTPLIGIKHIEKGIDKIPYIMKEL